MTTELPGPGTPAPPGPGTPPVPKWISREQFRELREQYGDGTALRRLYEQEFPPDPWPVCPADHHPIHVHVPSLTWACSNPDCENASGFSLRGHRARPDRSQRRPS